MKIAYILFDNLTLLDLIGVYDPMCRLRSMGLLPELSWDLCALHEPIIDSHRFSLNPTRIEPDLGGYDMLFVPGGIGTRSLQHNRYFLDWLRSGAGIPLKVSVCTGSLLLGAAGFLRESRATTHFAEYEKLKSYAAEVLTDRIVDDGPVITAGAVASSLDLGLYLCRKLAGEQAAVQVSRRMAYGNFGKADR